MAKPGLQTQQPLLLGLPVLQAGRVGGLVPCRACVWFNVTLLHRDILSTFEPGALHWFLGGACKSIPVLLRTPRLASWTPPRSQKERQVWGSLLVLLSSPAQGPPGPQPLRVAEFQTPSGLPPVNTGSSSWDAAHPENKSVPSSISSSKSKSLK